MMRFKNRQAVPPGGYDFKDPDTGHRINCRNFDQWIGLIKDHRAANNLPPIAAEAPEDQNCHKLSTDAAQVFCAGDGLDLATDGVSLHASDIARGTRTILNFKLAGSPLVTQEQADRRASICATCYLNVPYRMPCAGMCGELLEIVTAIVGGAKTAHHNDLNACAACKCSLPAKVWIPLDIIKKTEPDVINEIYPDFCWCKSP